MVKFVGLVPSTRNLVICASPPRSLGRDTVNGADLYYTVRAAWGRIDAGELKASANDAREARINRCQNQWSE